LKKRQPQNTRGLKPNTPDEEEATLKRKGLKQKTSDTNSKVRNHQLTEGRFINLTLEGEGDAFQSYIKHYVGNRKVRNHQLTEGSFAHLMLKGDGDTFRSYIKHYVGNRKVRNHQLTEGSFAHLTLEGESDAFRSYIKHYIGN
jgi:hypothetical protein